jgi:poly(A) polymerase
MCATFNITRSSMTIIQRELRRGLEISEEIMVGKRPWSDLFVKHTFFTQGYRYYISVVSASKNKEAHKVWSGYVESKVRMLVQKLEQHSSIALAHAFNKGYDRRHLCKNDHEIEQVQEGSLEFVIKDDDKAQPSEEKNPKPEEKEDGSASTSPVEVYTTTHYPVSPSFNLVSRHTRIFHVLDANFAGAKSLDLSYQVDEFKVLCTSWKKYEDELRPSVSLGVQHVRK